MNKLYIPSYHYVRDLQNSRYPSIHGLDYKLFKKQIEFFETCMHLVTMEEVIDALINKTRLPERAVLLTFDDGYIDNYTSVLPVLKEHHIQGSFFIPGKTFAENILLDVNKIHFIQASGDNKQIQNKLLERLDYYRGAEFDYPSNEKLIEKYAMPTCFDTKETMFTKGVLQRGIPEKLRHIIASELFREFVGIQEDKFARELYLNREQIRLMKDVGMFIGLHGYDHYWLGHLTELEMKRDIDKAKEVMDEFIDRDAWVMNYPYGDYNTSVKKYIREKGAILAFTDDIENLRIADLDKDDPFEIPRFDCNDFPPKSENYKTAMEP